MWGVSVWVIAAFFEELFYRGYLLNRFRELFGFTQYDAVIAAVLSSLVFGIPHRYQGDIAVASSFIMGLIFSYLYLKSRSLPFVIMVHGFYDTIVLALYYLIG